MMTRERSTQANDEALTKIDRHCYRRRDGGLFYRGRMRRLVGLDQSGRGGGGCAGGTRVPQILGEATAEAEGRCESGATGSFQRCFSLAFESESNSAMAHFEKAIEGVMANGVGRECAEALEEALAEPFQIPYFPNGATTACRAESRGLS